MFSRIKVEKGITLIALVITIIILIILAAVTIGTLTGDNGIIKRAIQSREATKNEGEQELINLITSKIRIEEKIGEEVTQSKLQGYINEVFGENKATGSISQGNYVIEITGGATYTITADGVIKEESVEPLELANPDHITRGAFVKYDVSYTDMYISQNYSTTTGWRLLDYTQNQDGTYSNVKLISTGIPARLYYHDNNTTNASWWAKNDTEENIGKLENFITETLSKTAGNNTYTTYSSANSTYGNYAALRASLGLYQSENFLSIQYKYGTSNTTWGSNQNDYTNRGYFNSITNGNETYTLPEEGEIPIVTGAQLFSVAGINADIRLLTLPEFNKLLGNTDNDSTGQISTSDETTKIGSSAAGLLRLDKLKNVLGNSYTYTGTYWFLASPYPATNKNNSICRPSYIGDVGYSDRTTTNNVNHGIRPVICFKSSRVQFTEKDGVLEIH